MRTILLCVHFVFSSLFFSRLLLISLYTDIWYVQVHVLYEYQYVSIITFHRMYRYTHIPVLVLVQMFIYAIRFWLKSLKMLLVNLRANRLLPTNSNAPVSLQQSKQRVCDEKKKTKIVQELDWEYQQYQCQANTEPKYTTLYIYYIYVYMYKPPIRAIYQTTNHLNGIGMWLLNLRKML